MDETALASGRRPGAVPDDVGGADTDGTVGAADTDSSVRGTDTDGDGVPDTLLAVDGADLLIRSDLDADGLVDRVLRIGFDGVVRAEVSPAADDLVAGSAPAVWPGLLGRLLGPDP
jgi:hypothetical protein